MKTYVLKGFHRLAFAGSGEAGHNDEAQCGALCRVRGFDLDEIFRQALQAKVAELGGVGAVF